MSIVTKCALECAACVGKRLGPAIDYAERARHHAITAAVANIILHKDGADFCANNRASGTCFEAAGLFAMLANVGQENPTEGIFAVLA